METHGDINKLDVYAGLGVREVWFWEACKMSVYCLEGASYVASNTSRLLADLDLATLVSFIREGDQGAAVRDYRLHCAETERSPAADRGIAWMSREEGSRP